MKRRFGALIWGKTREFTCEDARRITVLNKLIIGKNLVDIFNFRHLQVFANISN